MIKPCLWLALTLALCLSGCASVLNSDKNDSTDETFSIGGPALLKSANRSRVALDLVNTLRQVDGYAPSDGVLDISRLYGPFGDSLKRVLAAKGYRSSTESSSAATVVQFQLRRAGSRDQATVILSAGTIKIKRDYQLIDGNIQPASHMFIQGAPAENIEPDDSIFVSFVDPIPLQVLSINRLG